jgi:hypothetical protein
MILFSSKNKGLDLNIGESEAEKRELEEVRGTRDLAQIGLHPL